MPHRTIIIREWDCLDDKGEPEGIHTKISPLPNINNEYPTPQQALLMLESAIEILKQEIENEKGDSANG